MEKIWTRAESGASGPVPEQDARKAYEKNQMPFAAPEAANEEGPAPEQAPDLVEKPVPARVTTPVARQPEIPRTMTKPEEEGERAGDLLLGERFRREGESGAVYEIRKTYPGKAVCAEAVRVDGATGLALPGAELVPLYASEPVERVSGDPSLALPEELAESFRISSPSFPAGKLASGDLFIIAQEGASGVYAFRPARAEDEQLCGVGYPVDPVTGEIRDDPWITVRRDSVAAEVAPRFEVPAPWREAPGARILGGLETGDYFMVREEDGRVFKLAEKKKGVVEALLVFENGAPLRKGRSIFGFRPLPRLSFHPDQIAGKVAR